MEKGEKGERRRRRRSEKKGKRGREESELENEGYGWGVVVEDGVTWWYETRSRGVGLRFY